MDLNDLPGHVSYFLIAISYWATNILWLRVTAMIGLTMEIIYFQFSGGDLATGIAWDLIFMVINGYQLYWLYDEYRNANKLEGAEELTAGAFAGMSRLQLSRLAALGEWRTVRPGDVLTIEGNPLHELFYLVTGTCSVNKKNGLAITVGNGVFVGEMAYLTGSPASASVTVSSPGRAFIFNSDRLKKRELEDEATAAALHIMLGKDLAAKLKNSKSADSDVDGRTRANALH